MAKLASTKRPSNNRTVIQQVIMSPSTTIKEVNLIIEREESWMATLLKYLTGSFTPVSAEEEQVVRKRASKFVNVSRKLYKRGRTNPLLRCLGEDETHLVLLEVHEGVCGSHIGGRALAAKLLRSGYYWPTMLHDSSDFVRKFDKCQKFSYKKHALAQKLTSVYSPWPFNIWAVDVVGPFPLAPGQLEFLIVGVDYFTKWIEAEAVAKITAERVRKFY